MKCGRGFTIVAGNVADMKEFLSKLCPAICCLVEFVFWCPRSGWGGGSVLIENIGKWGGGHLSMRHGGGGRQRGISVRGARSGFCNDYSFGSVGFHYIIIFFGNCLV